MSPGRFDHFDWIAPVYDKIFGNRAAPSAWASLLELPVAGRLLDAGGGTGRISAGLRGLVDQIILIDPSWGMVRQAARKAGLGQVCGEAEFLPFPAGMFTRIIMVDAFHHVDDQKRVIQELGRVLAVKGRMVIEEPDLHHVLVKIVALGERLLGMRSRFRYPEEIASMLKEQGMTVHVINHGAVAEIVAEKDGR
jgi:ubiquinone/menaquinone biosynthesis C-methylase UbiE